MGDLRGLPVFHQRTGHTCDLGVKYSDSWQAGPSWHSNWWVEMWTEMDTFKLLPISPRRNKVSGLFKTIQKECIWKEFCGCMSAATMRLKKVQSEEKNWNKLLRTVQFNMPFRESFPKKNLVWLQTGSSRSMLTLHQVVHDIHNPRNPFPHARSSSQHPWHPRIW